MVPRDSAMATGIRTMSTEHGAWRTTASATLPKKQPIDPPPPVRPHHDEFSRPFASRLDDAMARIRIGRRHARMESLALELRGNPFDQLTGPLKALVPALHHIVPAPWVHERY